VFVEVSLHSSKSCGVNQFANGGDSVAASAFRI
jgi:hypothetical protein